MNTLGKVHTAVSAGLDRVSKAIGYKPISDLDIYKQLKAQNFKGMVEKFGHEGTLAYIETMEQKMKEKPNG